MTRQVPISSLLNGQKVIPVVVIETEQQALGLSQALLDGGVSVIEVTLRNEYGFEAVRRIKHALPDMLVLAGTVNSPSLLKRVVDAGADGIISPGLTTSLLEAASLAEVPIMPGIATASEILLAQQHGLSECKLFPASVVGGTAALKAFAGPFPDMRFCPTGGIGEQDYLDYLALKNVICVGGSWIAPAQLIADHDWQAITQRCKVLQA